MTNLPQPVKNETLIESIKEAKANPGQESSVKMLNEVVRAKLLAPITLDKAPSATGEDGQVVLEKDTVISFELIKSNNNDVFYPVFTSGEELRKCADDNDQHSLIVTFDDLANMVLQQGEAVKGFVIDPMGENICFTGEMIKGMVADMQKVQSEDGDK